MFADVPELVDEEAEHSEGDDSLTTSSPVLVTADPGNGLQIVDENQTFTCVPGTYGHPLMAQNIKLNQTPIRPCRQELLPYMQEKWHLANCGFEYDVVAVFGSQSTGKSKANTWMTCLETMHDRPTSVLLCC